jgi:hypothetical protein
MMFPIQTEESKMTESQPKTEPPIFVKAYCVELASKLHILIELTVKNKAIGSIKM